MSKKHSGHHGGAWKVAYADFVTAMMALFLCLWLTAQDTRIKEAVERAFRNPFSAVNKESTGIIPNPSKDASMQNKAQGNFQSATASEMEMLRHVTEDLARMLQQKDEAEQSVQLELTPDGLRVNIFDRSHKPIFEKDSAKFTTYGDWVFSTLAWEIARYETFKIELEGHTETLTPSEPATVNQWEISTERANAARRKLVQSGVVPTQVFKVSGFADTQPMASLPPTDEVNRRVTVLLKVQTPVVKTETASVSTENEHAGN